MGQALGLLAGIGSLVGAITGDEKISNISGAVGGLGDQASQNAQTQLVQPSVQTQGASKSSGTTGGGTNDPQKGQVDTSPQVDPLTSLVALSLFQGIPIQALLQNMSMQQQAPVSPQLLAGLGMTENTPSGGFPNPGISSAPNPTSVPLPPQAFQPPTPGPVTPEEYR